MKYADDFDDAIHEPIENNISRPARPAAGRREGGL
jgi:hypothetical protein